MTLHVLRYWAEVDIKLNTTNNKREHIEKNVVKVNTSSFLTKKTIGPAENECGHSAIAFGPRNQLAP